MRLAWAAVLCGCGRLGFDARAIDDAGASDDVIAEVALDAFAICHTGTWGTPQPLTGVNSGSHESDPTLTADGLTMFYTGNGGASQGFAIWTATRATTADAFGNPMLVTELDDAADDQDPSISPDGLTIYFDSDRVGAVQDLFVATRTSTALAFSTPAPVLVVGDPNARHATPAVTNDGLGLYYTSGGLELASAKRQTIGDPFTFVRELDELNAPASDGTPVVSDDELELFFETFRDGPAVTYQSVRASTSDMWGTPVALPEFTTNISGAISSGGPYLTPDGRTLYIFANTGQIDLYSVTRSCD